MKKYVADFETCTWLKDETYVWAWAVCEIGNEKNIQIGNNIDSFMQFCEKEKNATIYFHNAKFDMEFVFWWLFTNGFEHVTDRKEAKTKSFTTLIGDMGQFYSASVYFVKKGRYTIKTTFYDSLKIIPLSVDKIAKSFDMEISKLKIDYDKPRKKSPKLTKEEKDYITNDVLIVAKALKTLFDEDLNKMTQGSNALADYKKIIKASKFFKYFPKLDASIDEDLRKAYKGRLYIFKSNLQRERGRKRRCARCEQPLPKRAI